MSTSLKKELLDINKGEMRQYLDEDKEDIYLYRLADIDYLNKVIFNYDMKIDDDIIFMYIADPSTNKPIKTFFKKNISREIDDIELTRVHKNKSFDETPIRILPVSKSFGNISYYAPTYAIQCLMMMLIEEKYKNEIDLTSMDWICCEEERELRGSDKLQKLLLRSNKTFIIVDLVLWNIEGCDSTSEKSHANVIIINTKTKEVDLFDPWGWSYYFDYKILNRAIEDILPFPYKLIKGKLQCPATSFQFMCEIGEKNSASCISGYCAIWTYWWIEMILTNPNNTIYFLYKDAYQYIQSERKYIRDYANDVMVQIIDKLMDKKIYNYIDYWDASIDTSKISDLIAPIIVDNSIYKLVKIYESDNKINIAFDNQIITFDDKKKIPKKWIKVLPEHIFKDLCPGPLRSKSTSYNC